MKKITVILLAALCLALFGCSKDAEVSEFMTEWESVTNEMSQKLETGDVDGAQKIFDAKKASLKTKWDGVKTARGFQVSEDTKKKMEQGATKNMTTLTNASMKAVQSKPQDSAKIQNLVKEYADIFKM